MTMVMYTDQLVGIGYISHQWWDEWTYFRSNLMEIDIPENVLRDFYEKNLKADYNGITFEDWYSNESIADDMDGFFNCTDWRPFLADIKSW